MEEQFSKKNKCGFFEKPTHIVYGKNAGKYNLNSIEHSKFLNNYANLKSNKKEKNFDTFQYNSVSNTWEYFFIDKKN